MFTNGGPTYSLSAPPTNFDSEINTYSNFVTDENVPLPQ